MGRVDAEEAMAVLRRLSVLEACRAEPTTRRELVDTADVSRTTAYRSTTALVANDLLVETNAGYVTTPKGGAMLAASDRYLDALETIEKLEPLLAVVDHPELLANAHRLGDVDVIVADATNPYGVVERSIERLAATTTSVGTLVNPTAVEAIRQSGDVVPDLGEFERVLTESSLAAHTSIGNGEFDAAIADESIELLVAPTEAVPFSFAIDDDDVSIVGHDPRTGLPTVHVESAAPAAREWLEGLYEKCHERATVVQAA